MHKPILLTNVSLSFFNKSCFENFSTQIYQGSRIAIIGRNGSGKSSLLNILRGHLQPSDGQVIIPDHLSIGYVEQIISSYNDLSGGQRLNKRLSEALALSPDFLLLDEPTNNLDLANRKSLMHMLQNYQGTLIIISHDIELLRQYTNIFWHIDNNKIHIFSGSYDNYIREIKQKQSKIEKELFLIKHEKKETHIKLMKEQKRASKSKIKGQKSIDQRKWPTIVSNAKANRASQTNGKRKAAIDKKKQHLIEQISDLRLPKVILPKFSLSSNYVFGSNILSISGADIGYKEELIILKNVSLSLSANERISIIGRNASGKSTLLKAIFGKNNIFKTGNWHLPNTQHIGYLDQHYSNLNPQDSVIDHVHKIRPDWHEIDVRKHLNSFLFHNNEEVSNLVCNLSGGEKARLSLSLIAAKSPRLLILDEITNNLDLETKEHVVQVLRKYPGSMIIVSHEENFLQSVGIDHIYKIECSEIIAQ